MRATARAAGAAASLILGLGGAAWWIYGRGASPPPPPVRTPAQAPGTRPGGPRGAPEPKKPESTAPAATEAPPPGAPNLVVIDIDTLRADRVGATREGQPITPTIDALAKRGATFTHAISQSGWTLPAVTTLLTGSSPLPIASPRKVPKQAPGARDLPSILAIYGYQTAVFWGSTLPGHVKGFVSSDFATVDVTPPGQPPATNRVRDWIDHAEPPFFAWIHEVDLHTPDAMAPPYAWVQPDDPSGASYTEVYRRLGEHVPDAEARVRTLARYDSNLHAYDAAIAELLEHIAARGLADSTVIVVTSDHGEDLWDHAVFDHGLLYDSTLRVPLVVADPALPKPGIVVDTEVQGMDLAPSLLTRVGIPVDARMTGQSWLPLLRGEPGYVERPVFSVTEPCHASLRANGQKLILRDTRRRKDRPWVEAGNGVVVPVTELGSFTLPDCAADTTLAVEAYDLVADPDERTNLVISRKEALVPAVRTLLALMVDADARLAGRPTRPLSPEEVEAVRAQGYWGLVGGDSVTTK